MQNVYGEIRERLSDMCRSHDLLSRPVLVKARALTTEEAIGNPEADDFPLQTGKERLMQAEFEGALGQAFTDQYGDFEGKVADVLEMGLNNSFRRAIFVSTMNAVMRHLGRVGNTVHCRDREPAECAGELAPYLKQKYNPERILLVGLQPRIVEVLVAQFSIRVLDLDPDNINSEKFRVTIEGPERTNEAVKWADLLVVTGTTLVNGTIEDFLGRKPVLFYGTTIAGAAHLMDWDRFCARSH